MIRFVERGHERDFSFSISRNLYRENLVFHYLITILPDFCSVRYGLQPFPVFPVLGKHLPVFV